MLRMLDYKEANRILHSSLSPNNKCIAKGTALDNHADPTPLNAAPYGSFPKNRLVPVSAVKPTVFTITFINGSDNSTIETRYIDYGQAIGNAPAVTPASGYTFTGNWSPTIPATATANGTYTAVCEVIAPTTYTITFLDKDGNLIETRTFTHGATITTPTPPTMSGYTFAGWQDLSGNAMPSTATGDATYKATYTADQLGDGLEYFTITSRNAGTITLNISTNSDIDNVSYRISDGSKDAYNNYIFGNWTTTTVGTGTAATINVTIPGSGYIVQWKGSARRYSGPAGYRDRAQLTHFSSNDCQFNISNSLLTLLYNTDHGSITTNQKLHLPSTGTWCFCGLFNNCDKLIEIHNIKFPENLDGGEHHFSDMFRDCVNLTTADFTASSGQLLDSAYERMFLGCSSLTQAPTLPSTSLGASCYQAMFSGCTSLVNTPSLPATSLVEGCYDSMFGYYDYTDGYPGTNYSGCTNISGITMSAPYPTGTTRISSDYYTLFPAAWKDSNNNLRHPLKNWVKGANTSCTFTGDSNWPTVTTTGRDEFTGTVDGLSQYRGRPWGTEFEAS